MSLTKKIATNTAWQVMGKALGLGLSLVTAGLVMRYLGTQGWGQYSTILAFLQIFGIVMDFGLYIILIKKISKIDEKSGELVNNIFTLRLISGIIFLGIAPIIVWFFPYVMIVKIGVCLTTLFYLFISLNQLLSAVFQKFLATYWIAIAEVVGKTTLFVGSIVAIYLGLDLLWIMGAVVLGSGANFLINFLASRKYFKIKLRFDLKTWKEVLKEAWPVALSIAFALVYFKGDMVILSWFKPETEVGIYGAPYKMLEVLVTFPAMFIGLVLPVISAKWKEKNMPEFKKVLQKAFNFLVMVTVPMIVGCIMLAEPMMSLLGGSEFIVSAPVLRILVVATGAIFLGTLFTYLVVAVDKQKTMLWGYGLIALSSLGLYLYFIPKYSYWAAAWITVYSEIMILIVAMLIVLLTAKVMINLKIVLKSLLAGGAMGLLLYYLADYNLFFLILSGAVVYFIVLYLVKGISKKEIKELYARSL